MKKIYKSLAVLLCGVLLSCTLIQVNTVPVQAVYMPTFTQFLDVALNKAGISANYNTLDKLKNEYLDGIRYFIDGYFHWLPDSGYENNTESLNIYLQQVEPEDKHNFWSYLFEYCGHADMLLEDGSVNNEKLLAYLVYTFCEKLEGDDYEIPDENVELNKDIFDDMMDDLTGYYYVQTVTPKDVLASAFYDKASYDNFCNYVNSTDNVTVYIASSATSYSNDSSLDTLINKKGLYLYDNTQNYNIVFLPGYSAWFSLYDDNGVSLNPNSFSLGTYIFSASVPELDVSNTSQFKIRTYQYNGGFHFYNFAYENQISTYHHGILFSKVSRKIKIYKTEDALKNDLAGTDPYHYYINSTYDYSTNNDNSIKISGDYFQDYSQNSYDTITNNTENLNDYSQVDNSITNITNNYYTENSSGDSSGSGSGPGDSSDDDDSGGILGGFSDLLGGIKDIFGSLFSFLGDIVSVISEFLQGITDTIGEFQEVGAGFIFFMSDFTAYIPQEFWKVMEIGLKAVIGISVYRFFCK